MTLAWLHANGLGAWERLVTLDWMSEVAETRAMSRRTFHLAAALLDVLLRGPRAVGRRDIQAAAVAALLVASRHVDPTTVSLAALVRLTAGGATEAAVVTWVRALVADQGWKLPRASRTVLDALPAHTVAACNAATAKVLLGATGWASPAVCAGDACPHPQLAERWHKVLPRVHSAAVRRADALTRRLGLDGQRDQLHVHLSVLPYLYPKQ